MKLKSCPFCGYRGEKIRVVRVLSYDLKVTVGWNVVCEPPNGECGAEGPITNTKKSAVTKWNRRTK